MENNNWDFVYRNIRVSVENEPDVNFARKEYDAMREDLDRTIETLERRITYKVNEAEACIRIKNHVIKAFYDRAGLKDINESVPKILLSIETKDNRNGGSIPLSTFKEVHKQREKLVLRLENEVKRLEIIYDKTHAVKR